jgi:hypothetical protein
MYQTHGSLPLPWRPSILLPCLSHLPPTRYTWRLAELNGLCRLEAQANPAQLYTYRASSRTHAGTFLPNVLETLASIVIISPTTRLQDFTTTS